MTYQPVPTPDEEPVLIMSVGGLFDLAALEEALAAGRRGIEDQERFIAAFGEAASDPYYRES
jgi:hypothetical protein